MKSRDRFSGDSQIAKSVSFTTRKGAVSAADWNCSGGRLEPPLIRTTVKTNEKNIVLFLPEGANRSTQQRSESVLGALAPPRFTKIPAAVSCHVLRKHLHT